MMMGEENFPIFQFPIRVMMMGEEKVEAYAK